VNQISNYIYEKLHLDKVEDQCNFHPQTEDELIEILDKLLKERGEDADLNDIDVSKITDMSYLFKDKEIRNIDISKWDVSNVKYMTEMFGGCKDFNCDISKWNTSNVEYMNYTFYDCESFMCDISKWNVAKVTRWNGFSEGSCPLGRARYHHYRPKFNWDNVK